MLRVLANAVAVLLASSMVSSTLAAQQAELQVRLQTPLSTVTSKPNDIVEVLVVAPLIQDGVQRLPAGVRIRGSVLEAKKKTKEKGRAELRLGFGTWADGCGEWRSFNAQLSSVDNARETITDAGDILGLVPVKARPGKVEDILLLAAHAHPFILATVFAVKLAFSHEQKPQIEYSTGTDMTLIVGGSIDVPPECTPKSNGIGTIVTASEQLTKLVDSVPLRTTVKQGRPSDLINLMLVGSEADLDAAFSAAGWSPARAISLRTEARTFFAVAERHAYKEGPVSILLVDGRPPDHVFQKQNNTFAKRHHVRIWKTGQSLDQTPVWVAAATHDIGIRFSRESRTFTHAVATHIDLERDKIVTDLRFTGRVPRVSFVDRPNAPRTLANATGDSLQTDGRISVIFLAEK